MNLCDIVHTLKVVPESGIVKLDSFNDLFVAVKANLDALMKQR